MGSWRKNLCRNDLSVAQCKRMAHQPQILNEILTSLRNLQAEGKKSLIVFDLDSTLFDVSPRIERVLLDFASEPSHQSRFPEHVPIIKTVKTHRRDWGIRGTLKRAGLDGHHPELQECVRQYWVTHFFSNEYLHFDIPYDGSVEFVKKVHGFGAEIIYLTGRDVERMGSGSIEVLKKWEFPLDQQAQLVLKPHRSLDDGLFKRDWFLDLPLASYEKIWLFENEPVNVNLIRQHLPQVEMVFMDSTHSGKEQAPDDIPMILHFLTDGNFDDAQSLPQSIPSTKTPSSSQGNQED